VVPGVISAKVAALTEGVLKAMLLAKLKIGMALLLVVAVLGIGIGLMTHSAQANRQAAVEAEEVRKEDPPKVDPADPRRQAEEAKPRCTLQGHTKQVTSVAYSPDGKLLASGSMDQTIKLWDLASGKNTTTLQGMQTLSRAWPSVRMARPWRH
jgi:hypothetical protein